MCFSDANKILKEELQDASLTEEKWAAILGTHVLRKLAVTNQMNIDSDQSNLQDFMQCPCGCETPVKIGDNSMGKIFAFLCRHSKSGQWGTLRFDLVHSSLFLNFYGHIFVSPEKVTYRDYFRRRPDFLVRSITLSL